MTLTDRLPHRLSLYARLMRLDKPIGTLLLLWPTLWALWLAADGFPPLHVLLIFAVGTLLMRSAGCVINDYADRNFDGHVERTRNRPLATGALSTREALLLAAGLSLLAFVLILPLNGLVIWLSLPALFLAGSYPYTKRFLAIPQAYLGIAFGCGIPMGYAAILGEVPLEAWAMLLANIFWAVAYDTEYAMVDRPDDLKIGIRTSAITFGRFDVLAVMLCYAAAFAILAMIGLAGERGVAYFLGLLGAVGIALYHYGLIRDRDRMRCFKAFRHNNWVGAVIFAGIFVDDLLRRV
ncbi:4-hydroxybenzoate octaprenyltransferase [Parazoarcus communis]|uniref:4-hydroxybenzoate octaprenyltransferase n=1 Tax=Parazoarcus communis SWub3 = DSM 12120 TaxID=1121029 RepID=A0A323UQ41_9RHOO|nr:4-hydroxybenzoate octaprenyltransferase [Parazoarcus communis]NMG71497.1 4-hydroxybenzoate octaprenyltransferase [Parazoarcus communis SWub3 = DSM 12120]PZA15132.1 4-hydroxybenzoate octaprenyltransferase [Azoarcus communis] [Parazoarcus communis SWub3 = DSM 12120]